MSIEQLFGLLLCYVIGALPTSYLLVWWRTGLDVRTIGSGNSGATNAGRVLGAPGFLTVLLIDAGKAYGMLWLMQCYVMPPEMLVWCAWVLLLGNGYSSFLQFSGGKGVATALGILLFFLPYSLLSWYLYPFLTIALITRRTDAAALGAVVVGAGAVFWQLGWLPAMHAIALALWIWWRHKGNVQQLVTMYICARN